MRCGTNHGGRYPVHKDQDRRVLPVPQAAGGSPAADFGQTSQHQGTHKGQGCTPSPQHKSSLQATAVRLIRSFLDARNHNRYIALATACKNCRCMTTASLWCMFILASLAQVICNWAACCPQKAYATLALSPRIMQLFPRWPSFSPMKSPLQRTAWSSALRLPHWQPS